MNISNLLMMTGGSAMINKATRRYDKSLDRAFGTFDIKEYTPSSVPDGAKGIIWKSLAQLWKMLPNMIRGLYQGKESMANYIKGSNKIIEKCSKDECSKDQLFCDAYDELIHLYTDIMPSMGGLR